MTARHPEQNWRSRIISDIQEQITDLLSSLESEDELADPSSGYTLIRECFIALLQISNVLVDAPAQEALKRAGLEEPLAQIMKWRELATSLDPVVFNDAMRLSTDLLVLERGMIEAMAEALQDMPMVTGKLADDTLSPDRIALALAGQAQKLKGLNVRRIYLRGGGSGLVGAQRFIVVTPENRFSPWADSWQIAGILEAAAGQDLTTSVVPEDLYVAEPFDRLVFPPSA